MPTPEEELLGLEPFEAQPFPAGPGNRLLELLAGLEGQELPRPTGLGEGFLYGLTGGLGRAGSRVAKARQTFEAQQQQRRRDYDLERREATREARLLRRTEAKTQAEKDAEAAEEKTRTVTKEMKAQFPALSRIPVGTVLTKGMWDKVQESLLPEKPVRPGQEPIVPVQMPDGSVRYVTRSEAVGKSPPKKEPGAGKPATGAERQTLAFYNRAKDSVDTIVAPDQRGATLDKRVGLNPGSQAKIAFATDHATGNVLLNDDEQVYMQAQRQFTEARLRKESGAAISPSEYKNDSKTYFAQPGDRPAVIERKRKARDKVLEGLKFGAGKAFDEFYGGAASESGGDVDEDTAYQQYLELIGEK